MNKFRVGDTVKSKIRGEGVVRSRESFYGTCGQLYAVCYDKLPPSYMDFHDSFNIMIEREENLTAVRKTYTFGGVTFEEAGHAYPKHNQWYLSACENQACVWPEVFEKHERRTLLKPVSVDA